MKRVSDLIGEIHTDRKWISTYDILGKDIVIETCGITQNKFGDNVAEFQFEMDGEPYILRTKANQPFFVCRKLSENGEFPVLARFVEKNGRIFIVDGG